MTSNNPLRALRASRNLSQQRAADTVGVSRALWASWEVATREPGVRHLGAIVRAWYLSDAELACIVRWADRALCEKRSNRAPASP